MTLNEKVNTEIEQIELEEIATASLHAIAHDILRSSQIQSYTFTKEMPDGGGLLSECVVGDPDDNKLVVVSTYGLGGAETQGTVALKLEEDEEPKSLPYQAEFYMVADSTSTAKLYAETLAQIAFIVAEKAAGFIPGTIIEVSNDEAYLFTTEPLGIGSNISRAPFVTEEFALSFVAVTKIYPEEIKHIQEKGLAQLVEYLNSLGRDAYSANRPAFKATEETVEDDDVEISLEDLDALVELVETTEDKAK